MPAKTTVTSVVVSPGPESTTVRAANGALWKIPANWELVPPGDAALTRRIKAAGEHWVVEEMVRRKRFSRGVLGPTATIAQIRNDLAAERSTESYAKKQAAGVRRREKVQTEYVEDFTAAVLQFLGFHARYAEIAQQMAVAIAAHATPVGSGTVARTQRIPVEKRAEAAVIAWMRHQTTGYDSMTIARVAGRRREVRRQLAQHSRELLRQYRSGEPVLTTCPLRRALATNERSGGTP